MINIIYGVDLTVMEYNSLISSVPRQWRKHMSGQQHAHEHHTEVKLENKYNKLIMQPQKIVSKYVHAELITKKAKSINLVDKWAEHINIKQRDTKCWFNRISTVTRYLY
jgi:hypothetical protein